MPRKGATAGWRSCAAVALATALLCFVPEARAAPLFGFNDSPETFAVDAGAAHRAGATIARVPVSWELVEAEPGDYDWSAVDAAVTALAVREVRVLFVLSAAPTWAAPECDSVWIATCGVGDGFAPAYVRFGERLLRRYPGSKLQAWNEPDIAAFGQMSARKAAHLTRAMYHAAPGQVIGPAASPGNPESLHYTRRLYRGISAGVPMGLHLYPRSSQVRTRGIHPDWRAARAIAGERAIWVTEVGFAESEYGAQGQAEQAAGAYRFLSRHGARAIIYHRLRDEYVYGAPWLSSLGVLGTDGARKPAYRALRRAVASD